MSTKEVPYGHAEVKKDGKVTLIPINKKGRNYTLPDAQVQRAFRSINELKLAIHLLGYQLIRIVKTDPG